MSECRACKGDGREFFVVDGGQRLVMETCRSCGGSGFGLEDCSLDDLARELTIPEFLREQRRRQEEGGRG